MITKPAPSTSHVPIAVHHSSQGSIRGAFSAVSLAPFAIAVFLVTSGGAHGAPIAIENRSLRVECDPASLEISLSAKPGNQRFLAGIKLNGQNGKARQTSVSVPPFGSGRAIEVVHADGKRDEVMLVDAIPFALFRSTVRNGTTSPTLVRSVQPLAGRVELGTAAASLKTFGTGGLLAPDKNPGSYAWLAMVEPQSRKGVVFGWLTQDRGSGVLFSRTEGNAAWVEGKIEYGQLRLGAGQSEALETLAVGYFEDARLGLEAWAEAVAKNYRVHLPPQPAGYCTWYSQPNGGASDEQHLAELAAFSATNLEPFGFSVVQIDDKWQDGISTNGPRRNFTTHRADGPYPSGMKAAADKVKQLGLVPGIWFMPFAGTWYDPFFRDHQDWFVRRADGAPYETAWGGTCLDMTHPGAREHLRGVARRICREWGYDYIKVDGLWTGTATKQQYVNSGYKDDNIGDAVLYDPDKTNIEAYRDGLRLLREAAGRKVFVLGCNGPQNMRSYGGAFGLVDGMRIGPDNGSDWKRLLRGPIFGSRHYFLHGRVWYNDPDPVYVRASMPLKHAQLICSWVGLSGQLNLSSEWLPGLPAERLDILKRSLPAHGLKPRPADIFEQDPPRLWLLSDERKNPRRDVVGIFNWDEREETIDCLMDKLGLDPAVEYAAFDFWQDAVAGPFRGRLRMTVPAESCRILAVRPVAAHPQIISTSRHITQGIVDVTEEKWDEAGRALSGRSRVVAGDPYELRIAAAAGVESATVSRADAKAGVKAVTKQEEGLARVTLESAQSREVRWTVKFRL